MADEKKTGTQPSSFAISEKTKEAAAALPEVAEIGGRKPLGQILKEMRLVTESQIQEALAIQRERGGALGGNDQLRLERRRFGTRWLVGRNDP